MRRLAEWLHAPSRADYVFLAVCVCLSVVIILLAIGLSPR